MHICHQNRAMQCIWLKITTVIIQILFRFKNEFKQSVKLYDINLCSLEFEQLWSKWKTKKVQQRRNNRLTINSNKKILHVVTDHCSFLILHSSRIFLISPWLPGWSSCMMLQAASLVMVSSGCHVSFSDELALIRAENQWWTCSVLGCENIVKTTLKF